MWCSPATGVATCQCKVETRSPKILAHSLHLQSLREPWVAFTGLLDYWTSFAAKLCPIVTCVCQAPRLFCMRSMSRDMLHFYYMAKICRRGNLPKDVTLYLVSFLRLPPIAVDNFCHPDFFGIWFGQRCQWDDMLVVRMSRRQNGACAQISLALRQGFAMYFKGIRISAEM